MSCQLSVVSCQLSGLSFLFAADLIPEEHTLTIVNRDGREARPRSGWRGGNWALVMIWWVNGQRFLLRGSFVVMAAGMHSP